MPAAWSQAREDDHSATLTVAADFNHDGITDIARAGAGNDGRGGILTLSLGRADGSFDERFSQAVLGPDPRSLIAGDFNRDGRIDLMVGDADGTLRSFRGDGTGGMVDKGIIERFDSVVSVAVADFDLDGIPDLAVSDWRASTVTVLIGTGDGTFRRLWSFPLRMKGTSAQLSSADFNGDNLPDLAVVYGDDAGATYDVMIGNGKGGFTLDPKLSLIRDPNSHCVT